MTDKCDRIVVLSAPRSSSLATRFALELDERRFRVVEAGTRTVEPGPAAAFLDIVESQSELDALRDALDQRVSPTLVLSARPELIASIMPLLESRQDLALATDQMDLIAWRLQRLIDASLEPNPYVLHCDALTGLLNRRAFEARLRAFESPAAGSALGLLMLDLDAFKMINDSFGHAAGDRVLRAVGSVLKRNVRADDPLARMGGDEFACVIYREDGDEVVREAERLIKEIADIEIAAVLARESAPCVTASGGITFLRHGVDPSRLMNEADMACYAAKNAGRNRIVTHHDLAAAADTSSRDLSLLHFENSARLATERFAAMMALRSRKLLGAATREANTCPVTGLYSRGYLNARLEREMADARAQKRALTLALIDVDRFKDVNTTYGWPTGDRVLRAFAAVVRSNLRSTDWAAKYGGDEFVIVFRDTDLSSATSVVERVREAFASDPIESVDRRAVSATLSAGVAQLLDSDSSAEDFLDRAAQSLREVKATGRNRVEATG